MKSHKCLGHGLGCVVAALLLTTLNVLAAAPTVIYVRAAAAGANNGTSWTNAFTSLQSGLAAASAGDEVWVAAGTYKPTSGTDRTISFALVNGVGVYGGFAGTPGTEGQFVRDWTTNVTTLSGDLNGDDVGFTNNSENSYHVVYSVGCDSSAVLDGFTVTGGNANASVAPDPYGGGMYNEGSPTVTNCTFSGNWASDGGAILNMSGSPAVTNCTFTSNAADSHGGGMLINNISGSPAVTNCTFSGNSATDGGAVYNFGSPTVTNCAFSGNSASARGGGMFNTSSALIVANCVFSGNSAVSGGGMANYQCSPAIQSCVFNGNAAAGGGGMENNEGAQHISNCTFTQNTALGGGGGMLNTNSAPTVSNCVFQGNTEQGGGGGGLRNWAASPTVLNCTFSGNHGHSCGGAISNNFNSVLQVQNSTFTGNLTDAIDVSDDGGGGIENWSSSTVLATNCVFRGNGARGGGIGGGLLNHTTASATLTNCTFSGNSASQGGAVCSSDAGSSAAVVNSILWDDTGGEIAGSTTVTYTCVQGGYTGTGNISGDPLLANAAAGDFRLLPGSPCIDTGTTGGSVPATDIRGLPHVGAPDMGAYECQGFTLTITGGNPQSTSINQMFANPLSLSVSSAIGEPVAAGLVTFTPPASGASATLTGTPATILAGGAAQVTATANGTAGGPYAVTASTPGALNTVQFDLTNDRLPPPTVTASASPASGAVQLAVAFTANGSDADGDPLTYSWDFGDGSPASNEQNPTHTYVALGTYTATVTVSDGKGGTATASVTVTVVAAGGFMLGDTDSDGDGYYDEIETALSSSPADFGSTPVGLPAVTKIGNLYAVKTNIRLDFARPQGSDSIAMTGVLFIPAGFSMAGQVVIVDVGGVVKAFTLDAKGASPKGNERFAVKVKARRGVVPLQEAKFTLKMRKGTYAAALLNDGLVNEDVLKGVTVPETVIFNGEVLKKAAALNYRGHKGRMGMAR